MTDGKGLILLVDDTPANLKVLAGHMRDFGHDFAVARSGAEAVARFGEIAPDLVLLDVNMPGQDGFETCRHLKAIPAAADVPVIFLTARTAEEDVLAGFRAGGVDYVTKPFRSEELLNRIAVHLALRRSRQEALRLLAERNTLLQVLCHDLVNPLGLIRSFVELAREDRECLDRALAVFDQASGRALATVDMVRGMLAAQDGRLPLGPVDLAKAASAAAWLLAGRFADKGVALRVEVPPGLLARAEEHSLGDSVIANLLSNALKFSPAGGEVVLSATREEDGRIVLACRDRGVGIPEDLLPHLFNPGHPTTRAGTGGERGTGFGLSLVKKFVEAYGGSVSVASRTGPADDPGRGTVVTISLPPAV